MRTVLSRDFFRILDMLKSVVKVCSIISLLSLLLNQSQATVVDKLTRHPFVGQQSLVDRFVRDEYLAEAPHLYARYSSLLVGASGLNERTIKLWDEVLRLNPKLVLALQWPVRATSDCHETASAEEFEAHVATLGAFKVKIDAVELDGTGNFAQACGQESLGRVLDQFHEALMRLQIGPALTINGAAFPFDVPDCAYRAERGGTGGARLESLPARINGSLEEGWISRSLKLGNLNRVRARVAEACSWIRKAQAPSLVWAFDEIATPWWNTGVEERPPTWKDMRLGFATAQMYDRVIYIYNPTTRGKFDRAVNPERLFWGDYYAVDLETGRVPSYGSDLIGSHDDDLKSQLTSSGYLGFPLGEAVIAPVPGGVVMQREFECGYVYANLSPGDHSGIVPPVATRRVAGVQDPTYDDGSASDTYAIPAQDGLVLLKQSCIGR